MQRFTPLACRILAAATLHAASAPVSAAPQSDDWVLSVYGGAAHTLDGDVRLTLPGGTDLTFDDVSWTSENFTGPIYYGVRLTHWFEQAPRWGLALDYTHAKMIADLDATVNVSGTAAGVPVSGPAPLGSTFDKLQFTHGHNLVTVNGIYRWLPREGQPDSLLHHLQPYVSLGAGVAVPHVEVDIGSSITDEYQAAGPAVEGMVGVNWQLARHFSLFSEYKLSWARLDADLAGGGSVQVEPWTSHLVLGVSYGF